MLKRNIIILIIIIFSFFLDLLTKNYALNHLIINHSLSINNFLNFTLAFNYGAAFSFLSDAGGWQRWFFIAFSFIVIIVILFTFGYLINSIIKNSYLSKDKFSSLILIGLGSILLAHIFVNTAMTVGLIPVKGLPLPFISAGGTFLITSYLMIGLIMRFSINYSD